MKAAGDILQTLTAEVLFPYNAYSSQNPQEDLDELESVISRVQNLLAILVQKRSPFKIKINHLKSPIIRLLPPELLSHIFTLSINNFRAANLNRITDPNIISPFLLGSICRRWRDVAWSTPELWSTINLHLSEWSLKDAEAMVEEWLKRSGHLPLDVRLSSDPRSGGKPDIVVTSKEQITALIAALHRFSDRWQSFDIRLPTPFFSAFNPATFTAKCPLTALYIDPPDGQSDSAHTLSISPIPNLRKLHLCSVYLKSMIISWTNLTHVFAMSFYVDECLEILRRCPQLVCCKFPYVMTGDEALYHVADEAPIAMRHIRYLQIGQDKSLPTSAILDQLVVPSLEIFNFNGSGCNEFDCMVVSSLFARSDCNLLSFTLKNAPMSSGQLESLLVNLPSLRRLNINGSDGVGVSDGLLIRLADSSADATTFLPVLESLEYTGPRLFEWVHLSSLLTLPPTSISSKPFTNAIGEDALSSTIHRGRERLRTVKLNFISITEIDSSFPVPLVLGWLGLGRQFSLSNGSIDLIQRWIEEHSSIPEEDDEWTF